MRERIRIFLRQENKTSSQFAEEIGIQPSGVSHVLSGRNKPSLDFILKMLATYSDLNTDWLLFGKGEMYKSKDEQTLFIENGDEVGTGNAGKLQTAELFKTNFNTDDDEKDEKGRPYGKDIDTNVNEPFSERIIIFYPDGTFREYSRRK